MKQLFFICFSLILFSCSQTKTWDRALPENLDAAVNSSARSPENEKRDEYQHPGDTLVFFGIRPEMTVIEISPGAGYFTEILAPYLAPKGQYAMAVPRLPSRPSASLIENEKKLQDILISQKDIQSKAKFIPFEPVSDRNKIQKNYADLVLSFNSVHNWVATNSTAMSFKFFYDVLKPEGILGIVQHRISPLKKRVPKSGYMTENEVVALARKAGFKLVEKSEINANPRDTADYPEGVWVLPPVYRLGDKDRDKYEDIGESDRMTLKFKKI